MTRQYAFFFDSAACSGCKACQVACQDKHDLVDGRRWRRVYEITGGHWTPQGPAWTHSVFAYYVSVACNHCARPICVEVCPTTAMHKRADGIVLVDPARCIGCRYCQWACPYGAPQRDEAMGKMSKCHFCHDYIDQGRPPACVAACPMRALDFGEREEMERKYGRVRAVYPLPREQLTDPCLVLAPHRDAARAGNAAARIGNAEEV